MSRILAEYQMLESALSALEGVTAGQMFGKACIKIKGKAFLAQHNESVVFKLNGMDHQQALALNGAQLWDPSGKARPMKEWIALPLAASKHFDAFSKAALAYVSTM